MFNLSGSELIFLVLIALVVLGPDKLPDAMRKAGKAYADFKKMTTGFQSEMKSVLDEPMRELRETAELAKKSAMWDVNAEASTADHEPSDAAKRRMERAIPPDLSVSTASLPATTEVEPAEPAETAETAESAEPSAASFEASETVADVDDTDGVPSA